MGLFDGIGNAEIFERGRFFPPGFSGGLRVKKTLAKQTRKSGLAFIVELEVIRVDQPGAEDHELSPVRVGEKRTWFQKMSDQDVAFPSIKAWAAAMAGYSPSDKDAIDEEVSPHLSELLDAATGNPTDNDFIDQDVDLVTLPHTTQKGHDFTIHNWEPSPEVDEDAAE